MKAPFTLEQFLTVFQTYNLAIWPLEIAAYLLGAGAVLLVFRRTKGGDRIISAILSLMWLANGLLYHITFFSAINKAAYVFGAMFIIQALMFFWQGVLKNGLVFGKTGSWYQTAGLIFIGYAMVIYPLLGIPARHVWPRSPMFGAAPCPTTIYTFGLLLLSLGRVPKKLLIVPLLWSLLGLSAAVNFGIYEDLGLIVAGLSGTAMILTRNTKIKTNAL